MHHHQHHQQGYKSYRPGEGGDSDEDHGGLYMKGKGKATNPLSSRHTSASSRSSRTSGITSLTSAPSLAALSAYLSRHILKRRNFHHPIDEEEAKKKIEVKARNQSEQAFHQMFEALDQNRDGRVDLLEMKQHMDGLGLAAKMKNLKRLFNRIDRNGDGTITFDDFRIDWLERWKTPDDKRALLLGLFKLLDVTGDGVIEQKEVKMVMMAIGEKVSNQEIDEMFRRFDKNGSGAIDQNEFIKAMINHVDSKIVPKEADIQKIRSEWEQKLQAAKADAAVNKAIRVAAKKNFVTEEKFAIRITTV